MKGKICLITGANAGIGKATARDLAVRGATVVMVCRNEVRGSVAMSEIRTLTGNSDVHLMLADLASQRSIRALADAFKGQHDRLDVLVNNAGVYMGTRIPTEDGYETTFAVNHLAPFLLTHLLRDRMTTGSRIVTVSSDAHKGLTLDFEDLDARRKYNGMRVYGQSKLANILFTREVARRLEGTGITANCLHPGVVATHFASGTGLGIFFKLFKPFLLSPEKGAATSIYLATSPDVEGVSGKYFVKSAEATPSKAALDDEAAARLWQVSAERTGIDL